MRGRRAGEGVGWSQPQRGWGRVGLGIKDVGWCFPALYSAGWGPPSSQLVSLWASSDTDPGTDKQTEDPFDFSFTDLGLVVPLRRGQENGCLLGCGGEGSQLLPSDPEGCKRAVDSQEDVAKGLHGWVEQKQPLERFVSSAKITPSGPKWEASRAGRPAEPHPQRGRNGGCG